MEGKIGGDSNLSEHGWAFAKSLPGWIAEHFGTDKSLTVRHMRAWHAVDVFSHFPVYARFGQARSSVPFKRRNFSSFRSLHGRRWMRSMQGNAMGFPIVRLKGCIRRI